MHSDTAFGLRGSLRLEIRDAATGRLLEVRESGNLIVTSGLNAIASALNWAFVQNYNTSWGSPFSSASGDFADVYGAVGTGNITPAASDIALTTEIGRELIAVGTNSANVITYQFFFPTTAGNGVIAEMGVYVNASSIQTTLTSPLVQNQTYTSLAVASTAASIPASSTLVLNYDASQVSGTQQQVVTSGITSSGATTINVSSFVANASYPVGTLLAYNTGTLLDHALISPTVTKTNAQTATLSLSVTLQSA